MNIFWDSQKWLVILFQHYCQNRITYYKICRTMWLFAWININESTLNNQMVTCLKAPCEANAGSLSLLYNKIFFSD